MYIRYSTNDVVEEKFTIFKIHKTSNTISICSIKNKKSQQNNIYIYIFITKFRSLISGPPNSNVILYINSICNK